MKFRLRLVVKMLLLIVSVTTLIFYVSSHIINNNFKEVAYSETFKLNNIQAAKFASTLKTNFETDFTNIRSAALIMKGSGNLSWTERQGFYNDVLNEIIKKGTQYLSVWGSYELSAIDSTWELPYGRVKTTFTRTNDFVTSATDTLDLAGDTYGNVYLDIKNQSHEFITNPAWYSANGRLSDRVLKAGILVPITNNGQFEGALGLDIDLSNYTKCVDSLCAQNNFTVWLLANDGTILMHNNKKWLGENISKIDTGLVNQFNMLELIKSTQNGYFIKKGASGNDSVQYAYNSFTIGKTQTPWCILIESPLQGVEYQISDVLQLVRKAGLLGLLILVIVLVVFARSLTLPLKKTTKLIEKLAGGDVHNISKIEVKTSDEMGDMAESTNTLIDGLNEVTNFAANIGKGNYEYNFNKLSDNDKLGQAVIEMRNSLSRARNEEKQRIEQEEQLNWASQGINIFNRVLRVDNQTLEGLSYNIIETLTIYLKAHMGGIYLKENDDSDNCQLISYIGFPKEKYTQKLIHSGEGNVGRCMLEKDTIFINDVPAGSTPISSGLGKAAPRSILIVPLSSNQRLIGVLEIESLNNLQTYQIAFVEKLAETIASTIFTVKVNERTAQLLDKSQKQAEELEQQEEEMRQNMEEMQATQEEAKKREMELNTLIDGFNSVLLIAEYDYSSKLTHINDNYLSILKIPKAQLIGKKHKSDLFLDEEEKAYQTKFWEDLRAGTIRESVEYYKLGKNDYWINEHFLPVKDEHGIVHRILCVGIDITNERKTESEIKRIQEGSYSVSAGSNDPNDEIQSVDLSIKTEIIDLTYLKMLYKKDARKIFNILNLYYETLPAQILELDDIFKARDYDRLKSRINGLKSKMSYMGLKTIYEEYRAIERILADKKNLNKIGDILNDIKTSWTAASKELSMLLNMGI